MNVLVYSGPGTTAESVKYCLESLKFHLSPFYAVTTVNEKAILNDPWQSKTKALVIPGGADLPYCNSFNGVGNRIIGDYVRKGGKYIGFCAGGYYASSRCEFEVGTQLEVSGPRELRFFPGTCKGGAYKGFAYTSNQGARVTKLLSRLNDCPLIIHNYYNGGGVFANASKYKDVEVLARYVEPVEVDAQLNEELDAAVIYCTVGKGAALLTGTHPEYGTHNTPILKELADFDHNRNLFMKSCLLKLGLKVNTDFEIPKLTPIHLSSYLDPSRLIETIERFRTNLDFVNNSFEDNSETFYLHDDDNEIVDTEEGVHLVIYKQSLPDMKKTPHFDFKKYFTYVDQLYVANKVDGVFGKFGGYSEVITSTSSILDRNTNWLRLLPHGFFLTATTQIEGRGRGGNVWINPKGVLAQSILFKMDTTLAKSIVTLQYVLSLAVIELILGYGHLYEGQTVGYEEMPVKIKWPNDIYVLKEEYFDLTNINNYSTVEGNEEKYAKISGALINSQYLNGQFHIVCGIGINVSNDAPTTSLNLILNKLNQIRKAKGLEDLPPYEQEALLAKIMFTINQFYAVFQRSGMSSFLLLYYKRWMHSDQVVNVTTGGINRVCKIEGITPDHGLLVVKDTNTNEVLELQPDGNSFDIFKGLVYKKSN